MEKKIIEWLYTCHTLIWEFNEEGEGSLSPLVW